MKAMLRKAFAALALGAAIGGFAAVARAQGQVTISSWGGSFQAAEREAIFRPFERETGIKVVEDSGPTRTKIKAMVESGNVQWDIAEVTPGDYLLLVQEGLLEKIDYSYFDKETLEALDAKSMLPYGVEGIAYSRVIAWSTRSFPPGTPHPETWADVWDTRKFPGARIIDAGDYPNPPFEYALLADGVKPGELYPLDLDRAYRSLAKIRPHVVKWSTTAAMGPEALVNGEADIAVVSNGRIQALKKEGAPVDYTFNQGVLIQDFLVVPKGAKNYQNAMKLIAYYQKAERLAKLASIQPFGPPNRLAFKHLSPEVARLIPTYPDNEAKHIRINYEWWLRKDPNTGKTWREVSIDRWHQFVVQK